MKMIRHCKKGKIDLIITKFTSRFARNTLDSISYVCKLIDTIKVMGEDKLEIIFKSGFRYEQSICFKVRKLKVS